MDTFEFSAWKLAATGFFVLLNGYFVGAEFALVKVRLNRMQTRAAEGNRAAHIVLVMLKQLDLYLSACQLGITVASLILGWLAEPAVAALLISAAGSIGLTIAEQAWLHPVALGISLLVITMLHMTVGEQAPKMWSIQRAESAILLMAYPLYAFAAVLKPLIWVINSISNWMVRLMGGHATSDHQESYDIAEIRSIVAAAADSGELSSRQRIFGENILRLADLEVRHVMIPRPEIISLSTDKSIDENLGIILKTGHSRYPLGDPDLDHVKGLIHSRMLLKQLLEGQSPDLDAMTLECPVVPDTQRLSWLILDLQEKQTHCARVEDEHGTTIGFIFLEDAIEEIVGPMRDEFDHKTPEIPQPGDGVFDLPGSTPIPEASRLLGIELDDETDTIGGLVVAALGRIPQKGESIEIGPYLATVATVQHRRVGQLHFEIKNES